MYTSNPLDPSVPYQLDKDLDKFLPCGAYYYALSLKKSGVCWLLITPFAVSRFGKKRYLESG